MSESLAAQSLLQLSRRLDAGEITSVEIVTACLERITGRDAELHAWTVVRGEAALEAAAGLDRLRAAGHRLGPLHGVPIAVKDLIEIEGWPTSFGSRSWDGDAVRRTAPLIRRLMAAGMIVLGKTQLVEFAFGSWGTNASLGTPVNPVDAATRRVPGGSSSGSAVAVADNMVPVALGSDTGGSVRIPASLCGVVGFKPASGSVPMEGVLPLSRSLDTIGPLARRVVDAEAIDAALCGRPFEFGAPRQRDLAGLTVGMVDPDQWGVIDGDVGRAVETAARRLEAAGARVRTIRLPMPLADYQTRTGIIMAVEAYAELRSIIDDAALPMDPHVRERIAGGGRITAAEYAGLMVERENARQDATAALSGADLVLLPTTPHTAIPIDEVDEAIIPMSRLTRFANWLDLCALSVPLGRDGAGLPIGIQLAGIRDRRDRLFAAAQALEDGVANGRIDG